MRKRYVRETAVIDERFRMLVNTFERRDAVYIVQRVL